MVNRPKSTTEIADNQNDHRNIGKMDIQCENLYLKILMTILNNLRGFSDFF